jgi:hypothetical protein
MPPVRLLPRLARSLPRSLAAASAALVAAFLFTAGPAGADPAGAEPGPVNLKTFTTSGPLKKAPAHTRKSSRKHAATKRASRRSEAANARAEVPDLPKNATQKNTDTNPMTQGDAEKSAQNSTGVGAAETDGVSSMSDPDAFNALDAAADGDQMQPGGSAGEDVKIVSADTFNELDQAAANESTTGLGQTENTDALAFAQPATGGTGSSWIGILFLAIGGLLAAGCAAFMIFRRRPQEA